MFKQINNIFNEYFVSLLLQYSLKISGDSMYMYIRYLGPAGTFPRQSKVMACNFWKLFSSSKPTSCQFCHTYVTKCRKSFKNFRSKRRRSF